jgi:putative oxidoreductase
MNAGLLLIRVIPGLLLMGHGTQKLFGWFGGRGLAGTATGFESNGYRPGRVFAFMAGFGEATGGLLFALGLLSPLACAAIVGVMLNAIVSVHWSKGIWGTNGGFEYPLTLAVVAAGIAFTGPGRFSLDRALGLDLRSTAWGIVAVGTGLASGVVILVIRSRARRTAPG